MEKQTPGGSVKEQALAVFRKPPERLNCAQAVLDAYQKVSGLKVASVTEFAAFGGGRAPGGLCGALHAALAAYPEQREALASAFAAKAKETHCKELKRQQHVSCEECVALVGALLDDMLRKGPSQ